MSSPDFTALRKNMLAEIAAHTYFTGEHTGRIELHQRTLLTLGKVLRHEFVPAEMQPYAYLDRPLPIGCGKTISQPFIVALMTDLLEIRSEDRVLEIGTGLGYQAAVLAELARSVYTVEIIEALSRRAQASLERLGYANVYLRVGNGYSGWVEQAPFEKIMVTTAPELIPPPLIEQLKPGGRMVIPAGLPEAQQLFVVEKGRHGGVATTEILPVRFSQMEGVDG